MDIKDFQNQEPVNDKSEPDANHRYSGFWRRILAYFLDTLILGIAGFALGYSFYDYFLSIGQMGRAYGLIIYLGYFATLNSRLGGGMTVGKRMMGIRVLDENATALSLSRSLSRQLIIALPIFLNGLFLGSGLNTPVLSTLLSVAIFGIGGLIFYFLIFNRRTRRSLHDFICGTHVVKTEPYKSAISSKPLWKGHIAIIGTIAAASIAAGILIQNWALKTFDMNQLLSLQEKLSKQDDIRAAGVHLNHHTSYSGGQSISRKILTLTAFSPRKVNSTEDYALKIISVSFEDKSLLPSSDIIVVNVGTSIDLGIARASTISTISDTPSNWSKVLETYSTTGTAPKARISSRSNFRF